MCNALSVGKSVCDHMIYKGRVFGASDLKKGRSNVFCFIVVGVVGTAIAVFQVSHFVAGYSAI